MSTAYYSLPRSTEFMKRTPDFNESLLRAHEEGFTLSEEAVAHLKRIDRLDVGYWLSRKEGNRTARDFVKNLTGEPPKQVAELDRIKEQIDRQGTHRQIVAKLCDEDEYRLKRIDDIRAGRRRR